MNELFKKDYKIAEEKLYRKGYIVCNMVYNPNEYEIFCEEKEKVVVDNLSLVQLGQIAEIIQPNIYAKSF